MKKLFVLSAVFLISFGCRDKQATQPMPANPFELWNSRGIHDYTIDQMLSCYCGDRGKAVRITVRSDTIISIVWIADSTAVIPPYTNGYCTVGSLFDIVRTVSADSLVVTYNREFGYPGSLDVYPQMHPVDGGVLINTTNLQIL